MDGVGYIYMLLKQKAKVARHDQCLSPPPPSVHVLCYTFSLGRSICVVSTNQQVSCNLFTFPCNTQQELVNFTCIHYVDRAVATFEDSY